jgi:tetratricopeptide (TPR) repeat protein
LLTARYNLALLLSRDRKRIDEALDVWRENLRRDPQHLPSLFGMAEALMRARRWEEARRQYEAILAIEPESVVARQGLERIRKSAR